MIRSSGLKQLAAGCVCPGSMFFGRDETKGRQNGRVRASWALVALIAMSAGSASAAEFGRLEPYQMVRSLQLVQDQLAGGDHAALPMQRKLLEFSDQLFRSAGRETFEDRRNLTALFVYAMSGGSPATVETTFSRAELQGDELVIGKALVAYTHGDVHRAGRLLSSIDPMAQANEVAALLELVKGSISGSADASAGLEALDRARLLAPGTLVEEAALRRSLPLCVQLPDAGRFLRAANQYTRRFLHSPYASEFADAFVEGLVALQDKITTGQIEAIVSYMPQAQQEAIYLRLARKSTIHGHNERAAFAAERAGNAAPRVQSGPDARAQLYAAMAAVTSKNVEDAIAAFDRIDVTALSPRDQQLLASAKAVAAQILSPPIVWADETSRDIASDGTAEAADTAVTGGNDTMPPSHGGSDPGQSAALSALEVSAGEVPQIAANVREQLQMIDRLLEEDKR